MVRTEEIKKSGKNTQNYTKKKKKVIMPPDNHNGKEYRKEKKNIYIYI